MAICAALFSVAAFATDYTWTGGEDAPRPAAHVEAYLVAGHRAGAEKLECAAAKNPKRGAAPFVRYLDGSLPRRDDRVLLGCRDVAERPVGTSVPGTVLRPRVGVIDHFGVFGNEVGDKETGGGDGRRIGEVRVAGQTQVGFVGTQEALF